MSNVRHNSHEEDVDLIKGWRRGDLGAFEALVRKYQKRLLNIAFRITGNFEHACSIVQATFAIAYRGNDTLRGALRFSTWLAAIAVRLSRESLRQVPAKRVAGELSAEDLSDEQLSAPESALSLLPAQKQRDRHDPREQLQVCLDVLPADMREVLVLRDVQEFSYEELCALLKIRQDAVASRLSRARETLKNCLREAVGGV